MGAIGGDRISGDEFKRRREGLGLTQDQISVFAHVGTGVVDNWERGHTKSPRGSQYGALMDVLEQLERGETVVMAVRSPRRPGGPALITQRSVDDPDTVWAALDKIARESEAE